MKRLMTMALAAALLGGASHSPLLAQGKGKSGQRGGKGNKSGPQDGSGKQTRPQDGTGKQQGKGQKGKQTGPKDGTGPVDTPPKQ